MPRCTWSKKETACAKVGLSFTCMFSILAPNCNQVRDSVSIAYVIRPRHGIKNDVRIVNVCLVVLSFVAVKVSHKLNSVRDSAWHWISVLHLRR